MDRKKADSKLKKVVIIDTGYDYSGKYKDDISGIEIKKGTKDVFDLSSDFHDEIGHGTAIINMILKEQQCEIFVIKIFSKEQITDGQLLNAGLRYICDMKDVNFLVISLGVRQYDFEMQLLVQRLAKNGTIIISAFDNMGCVSYPAGFEEVIGVDVTEKYRTGNEFDVYSGDLIDVRGGNEFYRLDWVGQKKMILGGSSFLVAKILIQILKSSELVTNKEQAIRSLCKSAQQIIEKKKTKHIQGTEFVRQIKRAIVFPFNKEIHSIAAFEELCDFEVIGYFDVKYNLKVGKKINEILEYCDNEKVIQDYEEIDWNTDFDTVICGHVGKISLAIGNDYLGKIVKKCKINNKKLYSFDRCVEKYKYFRYGKDFCFPQNVAAELPILRCGKMVLNSTPTLAVLGTSSRQGKFTIQLQLMKELRKRGFVVGGIGTEPSALLYGFTYMLSYGYQNCCKLNSDQIILMLNEMTRKLQMENVDIIISGAQSGTIPENMLNLSMYTSKQLGYLLGLNPDAYILCVNRNDDISYIEKTIQFVNSITEAKLVAIVVCNIESNRFREKKDNYKKLSNKYGEKIFPLEEYNLSEKLTKIVIDYYK